MDNSPGQKEYIRRILEAYCKTPGTVGTVRRPDRLLAAQLHERSVPLMAVENALVLAAARRMMRPVGSPPLGTIRSLAYFLPVIEEVSACVSTRTTSNIFGASWKVSPKYGSPRRPLTACAPSARMMRHHSARLRRE